ncbi:CPP1 [Candida pseudojiufengensis]|uniref:CPP1 n=1 Tax=Candida pseudojiufengensis TaxID=497109 RepID=UPI002223F242|nr:CPP1 [Candida pseudojiufengensis]KAI5963672.1 CPP1 [Candida pseudojiufengensis]
MSNTLYCTTTTNTSKNNSKINTTSPNNYKIHKSRKIHSPIKSNKYENMTSNSLNTSEKDDILYNSNNQLHLNHKRQFSFENSSTNESNLRSPSNSPSRLLLYQKSKNNNKLVTPKTNHNLSLNDDQIHIDEEEDDDSSNIPKSTHGNRFDEIMNDQINSSITQHHEDSLLSTSSYSLQKPPTTNMLSSSHGYQSSISSISSNGSINSSPGLINYSPKHSRIINSLNSNRNMKNLSLNLNDSNGSSSSSSSKHQQQPQQPQQSSHKSNLASKRNKLSMSSSLDSPTRSQSINFIQPPQHLTSNSFFNDESLNTPSVTHTPNQPPTLNQQQTLNSQNSSLKQPQQTSSNTNYKFPPMNQRNQINNQSEYDSISSISDIKDIDNNDTKIQQNERIIPPAPPPFAITSKLSPLSTPPRLQSPIISNHQILSNSSSPTTKLSRNIKKMSIESPLETSFNKEEINKRRNSNNDTQTNNNNHNESNLSQNIIYQSNKFNNNIPEELQESTLINAYPNGPRNVLNNLIFLYSDPKNKIDINEYNLIINVAKECTNLSHLLKNQQPNKKEYIQLNWSHNSPISKDLDFLISKISQFYNQGLKILIHCQCGVSRSACVIVAFFMKKFKIGVNEAYEMLKNGTSTTDEVRGDNNNKKNNNNNNEDMVVVDKCDRICPNMSLIFELMEFGDKLNNNFEFTTNQILNNSPPTSIGI